MKGETKSFVNNQRERWINSDEENRLSIQKETMKYLFVNDKKNWGKIKLYRAKNRIKNMCDWQLLLEYSIVFIVTCLSIIGAVTVIQWLFL